MAMFLSNPGAIGEGGAQGGALVADAMADTADKSFSAAADLARQSSELLFSVNVNALDMPAMDMPAMDMPALELPAMDMPALELPAVDLGLGFLAGAGSGGSSGQNDDRPQGTTL